MKHLLVACLLCGCATYQSRADDCLRRVERRRRPDLYFLDGRAISRSEADAEMERVPASSDAARSGRRLEGTGFGLVLAGLAAELPGALTFSLGARNGPLEIAGASLVGVASLSMIAGLATLLTGSRRHDVALERYNEPAALECPVSGGSP